MPLVTYLENKGAKTVTRLLSHLKPLRAYFALTRTLRVDGNAIQQYTKTRLDAGLARATVNCELQALKQAYRLACRNQLLAKAPSSACSRKTTRARGSSSTPTS